MAYIAEFFRNGGIWAYLLLLLMLATPVALLVLTGVNAKVRRVPAAVWWLATSMILTVGAVGTLMGFWEVLHAAEFAELHSRQRIISMGFSYSMMTLGFAVALVACFGFLTAAGCILSAILRVGSERSWNLVGPGIAAGITSVVALVLMVLAVVIDGLYFWSVALPGTLLIAGLLVAASGVCATDDEEQNNQLASDRWLAIGLAAISLVSVTVWSMISHLFSAFEALEMATPESRAAIFSTYTDLVLYIGVIGAAAVVGLLVAAAVVQFSGAGRPVSRTVLIDGVTSMVVLTPPMIATVLMLIAMGPFFEAIDDALINPPPFEERYDFDDDHFDDEYENDRFHRIEFDD